MQRSLGVEIQPVTFGQGDPDEHLYCIPKAAEPLIHEFADAFTQPTYRCFIVLWLATILTTGRRTLTNLLRTVSTLAPGHPSSYHRVLSRRRWSGWRLARALVGYILRHWVPDGPVNLCGDDTVDGRRGKKVYWKACPFWWRCMAPKNGTESADAPFDPHRTPHSVPRRTDQSPRYGESGSIVRKTDAPETAAASQPKSRTPPEHPVSACPSP